jgi:hypothetical protein
MLHKSKIQMLSLNPREHRREDQMTMDTWFCIPADDMDTAVGPISSETTIGPNDDQVCPSQLLSISMHTGAIHESSIRTCCLPTSRAMGKRKRSEHVTEITPQKRVKSSRARHNVIDNDHIEWIKYWTTEEDGDWFRCWWLGSHDHKFTYQYRSNLPINWAAFLDAVKQKGNKKGTKRTKVGGRRTQRDKLLGVSHPAYSDTSVDLPTVNDPRNTGLPPVRFQSVDDRCVPFSLLNVTQSTKKMKKKLMDAFMGGSRQGGLTDLANVTPKLGWSLKKIKGKDTSWLLEQRSGRFLVMGGVHCIGVDCEDRLVFDCAEQSALKLCLSALVSCGLNSLEEIRQVLVF